MDILLDAINKHPNGTELIVEWKNGCIIRGSIDTIYKTDNGLELDDNAYQEFYACLLYVIDSLKQKTKIKIFQRAILLKYLCKMHRKKISLSDKTIIWEQNI